MELDDFKQSWESLGEASLKEKTSLKQSINRKHSTLMKRLGVKVGIQTLLLTGFALVFYDWFDGHTKPALFSLLLSGACVLLIGNNLLFFTAIRYRMTGDSLKGILLRLKKHLYLQAALSPILIGIFHSTLLLFLLIQADFTAYRIGVLVVLGIILIASLYINRLAWLRQARQVQNQLSDLDT